MINAAVRVEFLDHYPEPVEVLSLDDRVAPKTEADAFLAKAERGRDRLRQGIIALWQQGGLDIYTALRWLCRFNFVKFSDLPKDHVEWRDWLVLHSKT